ncbi:flagellar biosynthetic protein FliO [Shinella sp. PSBB067]|uniref:flagellar biosynthetic protein FliO n=1 Tax=Shinella sp. PSBB067 TaxID=2715959 RepID=UPI00193C065C|nr:flagellar biosynthetic protein FliO [Shinella sp. PSBB067]QRI65211.1 flagellar biosynthetic protein FliO [Shinella sp. PSBB067]
MFQEILAESGTKFVIAAVVVLLGLLCLALVLWIVRGRPSSPFIRGGRNRTPRLAVLDAAAIDTRRRLVLLRRDDVEHLVMIGGPTDIVIESRIVKAAAETAEREAARPAEKTEPASLPQEAPARAAEAPLPARPATSAVPAMAERRPAALPEGVSAMGKVLYAGDEDAAPRAQTARPNAQPAAPAPQVQANMPQRVPESRVEDMLEQNRQRVLSQPPAAAAPVPAQSAQRPAPAAAAVRPAASATDNPALVSEFEKLLEAEMAGNAAAPRTSAQPTANPTQTAAMIGLGAGKSREETEAEMARLLGEIAANRKA